MNSEEINKKEKSRIYKAKSYSAEGFVSGYYTIQGVKNTSMIITDKGNRLNEKILNLFLRVYTLDTKLITLLKDLNAKHLSLPDLLCINPETKEPFFTEVKNSDKKLSLSEISEKKSIKILAEKGYTTHIAIVEFTSETNNSPEVTNYALKEQGKVVKGEEVDMVDCRFRIESSELRTTSVENVYIIDMKVSIS